MDGDFGALGQVEEEVGFHLHSQSVGLLGNDVVDHGVVAVVEIGINAICLFVHE